MRMTGKGFHPWSPDAALSGRPARRHGPGVASPGPAVVWTAVQSATAAMLTREAKFQERKEGLLAFYRICSITST